MGTKHLRSGWLVSASLLLLASCSRTPASKPAPAPPALATSQVRTLDEARQLREAGKKIEYAAALEHLARSSDPLTSRRALAMHAIFLHDEKRDAEAIPLFERAIAAYPEVAPFLQLRLVEARLALGQVTASAALARDVAGGATTAATVARLLLPQIYAQSALRAETDAAWQGAMQVAIDELTEPDFIAMADALEKHGRADLAAATRFRLLSEYTQGRYTEKLYDQSRGEIARLDQAGKLALATKLSRANRYDQALDLLNQIPGTSAQSLATRMRAQFNSRNYTTLLEETKDVRLDDPALMLLRARAAWRAGRPQEFLDGLALLEKQFPASREAAEAKVQRAKYYVTDQVDYARSVENLSAAIDAGAVGSDGENIWNLGWTYTLWGRHDDALRTFARYIAAYPDGDWKTNSLFWSAKIYDRRGLRSERDARAAQIVAEYPFSYYAYRVRELWDAEAAPAAQAPFPDVEAALTSTGDARLATVLELLEIDLPRAAAREMKSVAAAHPANPGVQFMLADVYVRGGEPFKANGVLQRQFRTFIRHGGSAIPTRFWRILYPLAYWETIQRESAKYGHDPYLIASIIRQESGFEPSTVSNAGAVGLMQIMPAEATRLGEIAGLPGITREDLFDPDTNIAIGAAEYAQKLKLMNGNPNLAIAAYNAGERAVGTWIENTPVDDMDSFVEAIPYAETRLYVKTVNRNRFEYRRIYENSALPQQPATQ